MSVNVMENWLQSGQPAVINNLSLQPLKHPQLPGMIVSVQKGQAEVYWLEDNHHHCWILKKFHPGRCPDRQYLTEIARLLPSVDNFRCGTERQVLSKHALTKSRGSYFDHSLSRWLDLTVLMPKIHGIDWAAVADELRDGNLHLEPAHRLTLCRNLATLVKTLELYQLAHRDLSSGNILIVMKTLTINLIDVDSIYHPQLTLPEFTTCGTEGYTAPLVWHSGKPNAQATWCEHADRFSLAILLVEFLVLDKHAPLAHEGGMFHQEEIRQNAGRNLKQIIQKLKSEYPLALPLLEAALQSRNFTDCPSPEAWLRFCDTVLASMTPPRLDDLENVAPDFFINLLKQKIAEAPVWPVPSLSDWPLDVPVLPTTTATSVSLPPDPWQS